MRRNRVGFAGIVAVALALTVGTVVSSWQAVRATRAERVAERRAEAAARSLEQARIEEGKAWLDRTQSYLEEKNPFHAKLMAGRAIGFRAFGREKMKEAQRAQYLELLRPESPEARNAELVRSGWPKRFVEDPRRPIRDPSEPT